MISTLHLKIITPKKTVLDDEISAVSIPTFRGEITVLPHHTHLFALLVEGVIKIKKENKEDYLAIGGGYMETDGRELHILVSRAYNQNEIDQELIQKSIEDAKKILTVSKDRNERLQASAMLHRSLIDIKLLKKRKAPRL